MAGNNKSGRKNVDNEAATDYANEVYQAFMAGYVKRINESTLRVPIGGVRIGSAKYSRLAQINLQTRIITFSRFAIENVPERGRRYLVLHELAHVKEASHNKHFWSLVGEHEPEYKRIGRELEKAFHENVRDQSSSNKNLKLPLIRTAEDLFAGDIAPLTNQFEVIRRTNDGLLYPLDSGIIPAEEVYTCGGEEYAFDACDAFDDVGSGIMYGGADYTDELADDYLDHM